MIKQFVNGRVCVFIDAANILYSQQTLHWKVDYEKLKSILKRMRLARHLFLHRVSGQTTNKIYFLKNLKS